MAHLRLAENPVTRSQATHSRHLARELEKRVEGSTSEMDSISRLIRCHLMMGNVQLGSRNIPGLCPNRRSIDEESREPPQGIRHAVRSLSGLCQLPSSLRARSPSSRLSSHRRDAFSAPVFSLGSLARTENCSPRAHRHRAYVLMCSFFAMDYQPRDPVTIPAVVSLGASSPTS